MSIVTIIMNPTLLFNFNIATILINILLWLLLFLLYIFDWCSYLQCCYDYYGYITSLITSLVSQSTCRPPTVTSVSVLQLAVQKRCASSETLVGKPLGDCRLSQTSAISGYSRSTHGFVVLSRCLNARSAVVWWVCGTACRMKLDQEAKTYF